LKIKHLRTFPLPKQIDQPNGCRRLNELGSRRAGCPTLDVAIDAEVSHLFGIDAATIQ
jgi:hypothetical protein